MILNTKTIIFWVFALVFLFSNSDSTGFEIFDEALTENLYEEDYLCSKLKQVDRTFTCASEVRNKSKTNIFHSGEKIQQILTQIEELLYSSPEYNFDINTGFIEQLTLLKCPISNEYELTEKLYELNSIKFSKDYGFRFNMGVRTSTGDINLYNNSTYIGISWDILNGGLFDNKLKEKETFFKQKLFLIESRRNKREISSICRKNFVVFYFYTLKIKILQKKLNFLYALYEVLRKAYFSKKILIDEGLRIEREIYETESKIRFYEDFISPFCKQNSSFCGNFLSKKLQYPPVLKPKLITFIENMQRNDESEEKENLLKNIEKLKNSDLRNTRLRFYFNLSTRGESDFLSKKGIVAGFSLSIPLRESNEETTNISLKIIEEKIKREKELTLNKLFQSYSSYELKINSAVEKWYQIMIYKEKLRRFILLVNSQKREGRIKLYDYIDLLKTVNALLKAQYDFIDLEERLYKNLLDLFVNADVDFNTEFLQPVILYSKWYRMRKGERSIYIWSKDLELYSFDFIRNFLIAKGINKVRISFSPIEKDRELVDLLNNLKKYNIHVELTLSEPDFIFPEKWDKVRSKVESIVSMGYDVHLDIEPHILSDFKDNREKYLNLFVNLLKKIYSMTKFYGHKLTVAISPKHYTEFLSEIISNCDEVVVMDYGKRNINKLSVRLNPIISLTSKEKITLAIRAKDFENELEMEEFIDEIFNKIGIRSFAIQNLRQLVEISSFNNFTLEK